MLAWSMSCSARLSVLLASCALVGCGSMTVHELPPAAEPPRSPPAAAPPAGRVVAVGTGPEGIAADPRSGLVATLDAGSKLAVVSVRERQLELYDARTLRRVARAPAGVGPTHVACLDAGPCYVADTTGGALLVYRVRPSLELVRRLFLPGGPYGIALDATRSRLYVTLPARNELVQLPAHGRPHVLRRWPTVRQPQTVAVEATRGRVLVTGAAAGVVQIVVP